MLRFHQDAPAGAILPEKRTFCATHVTALLASDTGITPPSEWVGMGVTQSGMRVIALPTLVAAPVAFA